jgi:hypothetical protein
MLVVHGQEELMGVAHGQETQTIALTDRPVAIPMWDTHGDARLSA